MKKFIVPAFFCALLFGRYIVAETIQPNTTNTSQVGIEASPQAPNDFARNTTANTTETPSSAKPVPQPARAHIGVINLPPEIKTKSDPIWRAVLQLHAYLRNPQIDGVIVLFLSDDFINPASASFFFTELRRACLKKPIATFIFNDCTGGCYYASAGADHISASAQSRIGGIGSVQRVERIRNLKANGENTGDITTVFFKAGKYKTMLHAEAPDLTDDEKKELQTLVDDQYGQFCSDIASARHLNEQEKSSWAEGRIMSGAKAAKLGLIDKTETFSDVVNYLAEIIAKNKRIENPEPELLSYIPDEKGMWHLRPFNPFTEISHDPQETTPHAQ